MPLKMSASTYQTTWGNNAEDLSLFYFCLIYWDQQSNGVGMQA